jgi:hypothetical protein
MPYPNYSAFENRDFEDEQLNYLRRQYRILREFTLPRFFREFLLFVTLYYILHPPGINTFLFLAIPALVCEACIKFSKLRAHVAYLRILEKRAAKAPEPSTTEESSAATILEIESGPAASLFKAPSLGIMGAIIQFFSGKGTEKIPLEQEEQLDVPQASTTMMAKIQRFMRGTSKEKGMSPTSLNCRLAQVWNIETRRDYHER